MSIYASVMLASWLFCAAEPALGAAEVVPVPEGLPNAGPAHSLLPGGIEQAPGPIIPKCLTAWRVYVHQSHYAPGTLRNPTNSWSKHAYLAYRGNFFLQGYDYRTDRDYPWHGSTSNRTYRWRPSPSPGGATEVLSSATGALTSAMGNWQSVRKTPSPAAPVP